MEGHSGPKACLQDQPTKYSVRFGGRYINLVTLAKAAHYTHGYVSTVLSGTREPSMRCAQDLADALNMTRLDFLFFIEQRKLTVTRRKLEQTA